MSEKKPPQSPEEYPRDVREALDQHDVTHEGKAREAHEDEEPGGHMGAVEDEPTPVTPPMAGPDKVIRGDASDEGIDPREELTGG